ncbi:MAG: RNA polymerase subunit sigma [Sphingopyxis sp.]|nr:MAG: RNA polymerase subunit sigma [Sphingopyxis sp.]
MGASEISRTDTQRARDSLLEIMARVANSDRAALEKLYELTSSKLFGICLRICGDRSAAEDVLQEVYIKVWHRADQYQADRYSPISWLAVITRNASIDWLRKNGRQNYANEEAIEIIADDAPLSDTVIEERQQKARIMNCLEQLEEEQKKPIRSAFFGGYTYAALAKKIEVPLSTMKSRIRRGLMSLKKCLEDG